MVFGTGAMGSFFGARLARSGAARVTLAGTWAQGITAASRLGIHVEDDLGGWTTTLDAAPLADAPGAEIAFVLVKSHQTAAVAPFVASAVGTSGCAVTLQNGIGNREALASSVPASRLVCGVTMAGATLLAPGRVRGFVAPTVLGRDTAGGAARVADLFAASGLPTELTDDLETLVWRKLAVNCAVNALSALRGVPNGVLLERTEDRKTLEAAAREVQSVAEARGIQATGDYVSAALEAVRLTAQNRSSMLQDFDRDAPSEIEALNGAVVREALRFGVPVPVNARLLEAVRAHEAADRTSPERPS